MLPRLRRVVAAIATLPMTLLYASNAGALPLQDVDLPQGEILEIGGVVVYHPTLDNLADGRGTSCSFRLSFRNESGDVAEMTVLDWTGAEIGVLTGGPGATRTFTGFDNGLMQTWTNGNTVPLRFTLAVGGTTAGPLSAASLIDPSITRDHNCLPNSQPPTTTTTTSRPPEPAPPTTNPTPTTAPQAPPTSAGSPPQSVASTTTELGTGTGGGARRLPSTGRSFAVPVAGGLWAIAAGLILLTRATRLRDRG